MPRAVPPLLLLTLALASAGGAVAHADLEVVRPPPDERLPTTGLPDLVLSYSEPLDRGFSEAHLIDSDERRVEDGFRVTGEFEMTVDLPESLPDGVYFLTWKALSTADGHVTAGLEVYLVGNATMPTDLPAPPAAASAGGPAETGARAAAMAGLFLLTGVAVFVVALDGPVPAAPSRYRARVRHLAVAGAVVASLGAAAAGALYAARVAGGLDLAPLVSTRVGQSWIARAALAALAGLALAAAERRWPRVAWTTAVVAGVAASIAAAAASHSSGLPYPAMGVAVDAVHLVAGAAWLGALPALAVALLGAPAERRLALAVAYSSLATVAVAVVILSGVVLSFAHLGTLANLWLTPWGRALVVKLAIAGALLLIGAYNKLVLVPAIERGEIARAADLYRTASIETGLAVALLVAVAVLTSHAPPGAGDDAEPAPGILVLEGAGRYGSNVTLRIGPAEPLRAGDLHFFRVEAATDGRPMGSGNVTLRFTFLDEDIGTSVKRLDPEAGEPGVFEGAAGNLALAGAWRVEVVLLDRVGENQERVAFDVTVEAKDAQP